MRQVIKAAGPTTPVRPELVEGRALTLVTLPVLGQTPKFLPVAPNQHFFLGAGPAFDTAFCGQRFLAGREAV